MGKEIIFGISSPIREMNHLHEGAISFEASKGIFYNPKMKMNRDICVAAVKSLGINDYLDALSASGIRGLRVAKEAGVAKVTLNDVSPRAHECIQYNIKLNGLNNCIAFCCNANALMHMRHFQAVDLDPFGSPSQFMSAAARSALSYLMITATDTAPLCGAHFKSGKRMYLARPIKTDYHKEMGARILLGLAARELARHDKSMTPLLTYAIDHYVRTYLGVRRGARLADACLDNLGHVEHCYACGSFKILMEPRTNGKCVRCSSDTVLSGPLWLGNIHDQNFLNQCLKYSTDNKSVMRLLEICASEDEVPFYYDHHSICRRLGITPAKVDRVIDLLRESGWKASRTHFNGLGIKTDAPINDLDAAVMISSASNNF